MFCEEKKKIVKKESQKGTDSSNKQKTILDGKRLMNVSISTSKIKIPLEKIQEILLNYDMNNTIDVDTISTLLSIFPTEEEIKSFKEFSGDIKSLSQPDQYCYMLVSINNCKKILTFLQFKKTLPTNVGNILLKIKALQECLTSINQSEQFKMVLFILRQIGNFLNTGTSNGKALGFNISSLDKLDSVKGFNKEKTSLLEFLVINIKSKNPNYLNFYKDFNRLEEASHVDKNDLEKEIGELQNELKKIKLEQETKDEDYLLFLNNVDKYSTIKIDCIKISQNILEKEIETCYTTFGETKEKFNLSTFLKSIDNFVNQYKAKLLEISQKEAKLLKKKIAEEKKKKKKMEKENKIENIKENKKEIKILRNLDNNLEVKINERRSRGHKIGFREEIKEKLSQEIKESKKRESKFSLDFEKIKATATRKTIARRTAIKKDLKEIKDFIREERERIKSQSKDKVKNNNPKENKNLNKREDRMRFTNFKINQILEEDEDNKKDKKNKIEKDIEFLRQPMNFGSRQKHDNAIKIFGERGSAIISKEKKEI